MTIKEYLLSKGWEPKRQEDYFNTVYGYGHVDYPYVLIFFPKEDSSVIAIGNSTWLHCHGGEVPIPLKMVRIRDDTKLEELIKYLLPFAVVEDY